MRAGHNFTEQGSMGFKSSPDVEAPRIEKTLRAAEIKEKFKDCSFLSRLGSLGERRKFSNKISPDRQRISVKV